MMRKRLVLPNQVSTHWLSSLQEASLEEEGVGAEEDLLDSLKVGLVEEAEEEG